MAKPDPYNYNKAGSKTTSNLIEFNPPINRFASGAYADSRKNERSENPNAGRNDILGPDYLQVRSLNKGVIYQDFGTAVTDKGDSSWGVTNPQYKNFKTIGDTRFGFKFHYNPSTIDFSVNAENKTIDPALILSGTSRAMPIAPPSLPLVNFSLIINRIEDVTMLRKGSFGNKDMKYFYGRNLSDEEVKGLTTRGSGYDLEYLFRTMLGRPYVTDLRGTTADIGIAFGLPLILDFSPKTLSEAKTANTSYVLPDQVNQAQHGQRYWGRIHSVSYTHREFTQEMIPMFTEVFVNFARFPDAKGERPDLQQDTSDPNSPAQLANGARLTGLAKEYLAGRHYVPWTGPVEKQYNYYYQDASGNLRYGPIPPEEPE